MTPAETFEQLEQRAVELRKRVAEHRKFFGTHSMAEDIKQALLEYVADALGSGLSWTGISKRLRIDRKRLMAWKRDAEAPADPEDIAPLPVMLSPTEPATKASLPPVTESDVLERAAHSLSRTGGTLALVSPSGWRVEGLALADALALLRMLE